MMESFRNWFEEAGLADPNVMDQGPPKIKNKKVPDKYKIPDVSTWSFERQTGMAKRVEARQVGEIPKKNKIIPTYKYDVTQAASTRLDPGGSPAGS